MAKIDVQTRVSTLAAGAEGVWFLNSTDHDVTRIDPATNRVAERIPIKTGGVRHRRRRRRGLGHVGRRRPCSGASSPDRRSASGRSTSAARSPSSATATGRRGRPTTRTAWSLASTAARTPSPSRSASKLSSPWPWAPARPGSASRAAPRDGTLPAAACTPVESGGATPDVLIASDFPLQGDDADITRGLADAIRWVLKDHGFRAGRHRRRLPVLRRVDGADRRLRAAALRRERQRVRPRRAGRGGDRPVLVVLRPAADPDPQPRSGRPARAGQPVEHRPEPHAWTADRARGQGRWHDYPTGTRNYARVIGRADVEGVALALLAQRLRLARVYLLDPDDDDLRGLLGDPFRRAAARLGVGVAGSDGFGVDTDEYAAVADRVARARVDGVVIGGTDWMGGALVKALRARLGPRVAIMVGDQFNVGGLIDSAGRAARRRLPGDDGSAARRRLADAGRRALRRALRRNCAPGLRDERRRRRRRSSCRRSRAPTARARRSCGRCARSTSPTASSAPSRSIGATSRRRG